MLSGDATQEKFGHLCYFEIKHGHICQLVFLEQVTNPAGIIAFIGVLECAFMSDVPGTGNKIVSHFRNGYIYLGWDDFDEETRLQKRTIKLKTAVLL